MPVHEVTFRTSVGQTGSVTGVKNYNVQFVCSDKEAFIETQGTELVLEEFVKKNCTIVLGEKKQCSLGKL